MIRFITSYVRRSQKTLKYEFAVVVCAVWICVTTRIFLSGDAAWVGAQAVNYSTITTSVLLYITAAVGIQAWQNTQPAGAPGTTTTTVDTAQTTTIVEPAPDPAMAEGETPLTRP